MTRETGVIESVLVRRSGSSLTVDVAAGGSVLPLDSVVDFDDDGGALQINDEQLAYVSVDRDAETVTLAGTLAADATAADPVLTLDASGSAEIEWLVYVDLGEGDAIPAEVDDPLRGYFPEGTSIQGLLAEVESFEGGNSRNGEDGSTGYRAVARPFQEATPDSALTLTGDDASGETIAGLSPTGGFAARDLDVTNELRIALAGLVVDGQPLDDLLGSFSRGIWGWGERTPDVTKIGNTGYGVLAMRLYLPEARRASFHLQTRTAHSAGAGSRFNAVIRANYSATTEPSQATGVSANYATFRFTTDVGAGNADTYVSSFGRVLEAGYYSLRLELRTITGGHTLDTVGATVLEVTDRGPANASENQAFKPTSPGSLEAGGADAGSAAAPSTRTQVYEYDCINARSYKGDGSLKTFDGDLWVGAIGFGEGNCKSALWFDDAKIRDDLAGATVTKVELWLYAMWRPSTTSGVMVIGTHGDSTPRSAWVDVGGKVLDRKRESNWVAPEGRWVTLPNWGPDLANGDVRGVLVGPGPTTSTTYAFGLYGPDRAKNGPRLRVTAER